MAEFRTNAALAVYADNLPGPWQSRYIGMFIVYLLSLLFTSGTVCPEELISNLQSYLCVRLNHPTPSRQSTRLVAEESKEESSFVPMSWKLVHTNKQITRRITVYNRKIVLYAAKQQLKALGYRKHDDDRLYAHCHHNKITFQTRSHTMAVALQPGHVPLHHAPLLAQNPHAV